MSARFFEHWDNSQHGSWPVPFLHSGKGGAINVTSCQRFGKKFPWKNGPVSVIRHSVLATFSVAAIIYIGPPQSNLNSTWVQRTKTIGP